MGAIASRPGAGRAVCARHPLASGLESTHRLERLSAARLPVRRTAMRDDHRVQASPPRFFGAMSPYSWLAAERIDGLLTHAQWQGVLAGAIFRANDRVSWGLSERRSAGIADCEARAAEHGLGPIRWPEPWPTSDLLVARAMAFAEARGALKPFALVAMRLAFLGGVDLGDLEAVLEAARLAGIDPHEMQGALADPVVKDALRSVTEEALALGVFGVPTVAIGDEL